MAHFKRWLTMMHWLFGLTFYILRVETDQCDQIKIAKCL